jgi:hypothetical protein
VVSDLADQTPPEVEDHPFQPRGPWWSLCKECGLAAPAHATTTASLGESPWRSPLAVLNQGIDRVEDFS